jgi:hypothetical protein
MRVDGPGRGTKRATQKLREHFRVVAHTTPKGAVESIDDELKITPMMEGNTLFRGRFRGLNLNTCLLIVTTPHRPMHVDSVPAHSHITLTHIPTEHKGTVSST